MGANRPRDSAAAVGGAVLSLETGASAWMKTKAPQSTDRGASFGALDRIRTYDLLLRRQTLYPLSYEGNPDFLPLLAGRPRA
jgi:hypothetical protein